VSPKTGGAGRPATVVITDCDHATIDPELEVLGAAGVEVRLEACRTAGDVIAVAADADALLVQYASIDEQVLQALERCRAVVRYGVGVDTIDVEAATRHGVWVVNVPDYGTEEVSDHALALLLALLRGVVRLDRSVRGGVWDVGVAAPLRRVSTLTVGVVGCGRIGGAFARKVAALGLRVIAHDPLGVPEALQRLGVEPAGLDALLASADAVSIHAPLDAGTKHLLGAAQLARMKDGAYLVNTARGGLVDVDALLQALDAGHLAGAALDVLEGEPPAAGDPALAHDRLILTPHAAWYSEESFQTLKAEAAREAVRVLSGERPRSPVNNPMPGGPRA
jgi:D-3-phosphoglycerate dehydrogenase / 2-oxoglutarate reductase